MSATLVFDLVQRCTHGMKNSIKPLMAIIEPAK
jgi:hypothetical protein